MRVFFAENTAAPPESRAVGIVFDSDGRRETAQL